MYRWARVGGEPEEDLGENTIHPRNGNVSGSSLLIRNKGSRVTLKDFRCTAEK